MSRLYFAIAVTTVFLISLFASIIAGVLVMAAIVAAVMAYINLGGAAPPANPTLGQRRQALFTRTDANTRERRAEWVGWCLIPFLGTNNRWWAWVGLMTIISTFLFLTTPMGDTLFTFGRLLGKAQPWWPYVIRLLMTLTLWLMWIVYFFFAFADEARRSYTAADRFVREHAEGTSIEPIFQRLMRYMLRMPTHPPRHAPRRAGHAPAGAHGNGEGRGFNRVFVANFLAEVLGNVIGPVVGRWF